MEAPPKRLSPSEELSNALVVIFKEYVGRGPTKARVLIHGDVVLGLFSDTLTKAERTLMRNGDGEIVRTLRRKFQDTMRSEMTAAVERVVGRTVVAFMSDNHLDPDVAGELFLLAPLDPGSGRDRAHESPAIG